MRIALAGTTGVTGGLVLNRLMGNDAVSEVISIGRRPTGIKHPKLGELIWDGRSAVPEVRADAFICCLGTTRKKAGTASAFRAVDLEFPLALARALKTQGCETMIIVSAMGANAASPLLYSRTKGELEEKLRPIGFSSLGILRPALISGRQDESRPLEQVADRVFAALNPLLVGPLAHYRSIHADQVAAALVALACNPRPGVTFYWSEAIKRIQP